MLQFLGALGAVGLFITLIFLTKLRSLNPALKAAVIGVRIILFIIFIFIIFILYAWRDGQGQGFFGNIKEDLTNESIIGKWEVKYGLENGSIHQTSLYFYSDSSFYDSYANWKGKWKIDPSKDKLVLSYDNYKNEFKILGFNGEKIITDSQGEFLKIEDNLPDINSLIKNKTVQEQQATKSLDKMEGNWGLKLVQGTGISIQNLGVYYFDGYGGGKHENRIINYKLDLNKKRFTISDSNEVILLNIKSFDEELLIGYPNEEPDNKYVLAKSL
jgi:hypothetical protein